MEGVWTGKLGLLANTPGERREGRGQEAGHPSWRLTLAARGLGWVL